MSLKIVDMVDTIHADVNHVPANFPKVAGYITGSSDIEWTAADWARFHGAKVRIDQAPSRSIRHYDVCDIEQNAQTIAIAIDEARQRKALGFGTTFYVTGSELPVAEEEVKKAGLSDVVNYWLANPSLSRDQAIGFISGRIVAVQWAWPTTNPDTLIPGTNITLSEANVDLSVTAAHWHPVPGSTHPKHHRVPKPKRPAHPVHALAGGGLGTGLVAVLAAAGAHLTPTEAAAITAGFSTLQTAAAAYLPKRKR